MTVWPLDRGTKHIWQEQSDGNVGMNGRFKCVLCGAEFAMTFEQSIDPLVSPALAATSHGVPETCEEERVRQVMES